MKKILTLAILALLCNVAFSQADTNIKSNEKYNESLSLINTATKYSNKYDFKKALKYYMQALEIQKNILGENNPEYATTLYNIGAVYSIKGNHRSAFEYHSQAMEIRKKVLGEKHPDYASSLSNIGTEYYYLEDYQNALKFHTQAMDIQKNVLGEDNPDYAASLNNMGLAYSSMGDHKTAMKYFMQAMEIRKKVLGEENIDYTISLNNIGLEYSNIGDHQTALEYCKKAQKIQERTIGKKKLQYASTLSNIGIIYSNICDVVLSKTGDIDSIQDNMRIFSEYAWPARRITKKILGNKHLDYAKLLHYFGSSTCYYLDYWEKQAYPFSPFDLIIKLSLHDLNQVSAIRKEILGEEHSDYAKTLKKSALLYLHLNDKAIFSADPLLVFKSKHFDTAINVNSRATEIFKKKLISNFSFMTARERERYWETLKMYFDQDLKFVYYLHKHNLYTKGNFNTNLIHDNIQLVSENNNQSLRNYPLATKTAYNTELITKGLLLASEISTANVIMESGDSSLVTEYEKMRAMQIQLNDELEKPIEDRIYNCDSLENEIQKMERHIVEGCKEFGDITHFIKIDWKEVQNSLKPNDVAIEFANFTDNDTSRYMALVLTKRMEAPACVQLFEQSEIQKLQRGIAPAKNKSQNDDDRGAYLVSSSKRQGIYETTGLYEMLWKPLEKYFPENPRIYFAPSGMLHQIAVEYAPIGNGQLISDKYEMYRVSSTRFLAMDYTPKPLKNSVLYGGVYYDSDTSTMKQESKRFAMRGTGEVYMSFASLNKDEARSSLPYLQGTQTEVENIAEEMRGKNISTTLYEGSSANEESFKALSGKEISVLHIATHGFFLPTDEKLSGDQSLVQSGLLLSGANYAWQNKPLPEGIEDGILTAKEISFMDLRKTDLVVLSACQTALGEITGEGVFGLQRGFKKAGARTIIMSLWPVDDNATLLMMTEFYTNLTKGMTKREAFITAQNKVKTTAGFENPRYWAAFIMLDGNEK